MNKDSICRYCRHYRPDERYRGVIGWCEKHDAPAQITDECEEAEKGKQYWLCGKEVKE